MMEYYENIVNFWIFNLIGNEDEYNIKVEKVEDKLNIEIFVKKEFVGKVIGKNGKIITSIRNLISAISYKDKKIVDIKVKEL